MATDRRARCDAFTLVELLVVIAIVSLLAGLLLPALETALETARRAACLNNLRQLHLTAVQYAGDTGELPHPGAPGGAGWQSIGANTSLRSASMLDWLSVNHGANGWELLVGLGYVEETGAGLLPAIDCPSMDVRAGTASHLHYDYRYNCDTDGLQNGGDPRRGLETAEAAALPLFNECSCKRTSDGIVPYETTTDTGWSGAYRWAHGDGGHVVEHAGAARFIRNDPSTAGISSNQLTWPSAEWRRIYYRTSGPNEYGLDATYRDFR